MSTFEERNNQIKEKAGSIANKMEEKYLALFSNAKEAGRLYGSEQGENEGNNIGYVAGYDAGYMAGIRGEPYNDTPNI